MMETMITIIIMMTTMILLYDDNDDNDDDDSIRFDHPSIVSVLFTTAERDD